MDAWLKVPGDGETWNVDVDFLTSNWTCIWDRGCAGIEVVADVDGQLGCCSVGAELLDDDEAMLISAIATTLDPEFTQFADVIAERGALRDDRRNTRVVDGACIFLNRPGFSGGTGCALHAEALRTGESPIDSKPSICWQLPVRVERTEQPDGSTLATLRSWSRADWGPDGETMAYCCTQPRSTDAADAFVGEQPVVVSLREELVALMGHKAYDSVVDHLADKGGS